MTATAASPPEIPDFDCEITQEIINAGARHNIGKCPVAKALQTRYPGSFVLPGRIYPGQNPWTPPEERAEVAIGNRLVNFIDNFDNCGPCAVTPQIVSVRRDQDGRLAADCRPMAETVAVVSGAV